MSHYPDFYKFEATFKASRPQVVWRRLIADLETPVSAMMKLAHGRDNSFLLESVEGSAVRGRYSFIGFDPDLIWRCVDGVAGINTSPATSDDFPPCPTGQADGVQASLKQLVRDSRIELPDDLPPMAAGLVGYMAYDMVRVAENIADDNPDVIGVPDGLFLRPSVMAIFDALKDSLIIVTPVWDHLGTGADVNKCFDAAVAKLEQVVVDVHAPLPALYPMNNSDISSSDPTSNMDKEYFLGMVKKAKEYIINGDAFQIVPSQRFTMPFRQSAFTYYRSLRRLNPSPFLFYLNFGKFSVVGSSPEILVRVRDGEVTIRPLAGTRKRGKTAEEDRELSADLLGDKKECAEHLMLLDLGRNDVGRVSKIGTVKVTEQFKIEYYSHVMHIASNVTGELDASRDAIDALLAGFPAGTVSGAPKVRAMEIIDELEPHRRGVYGGCIGYFGADGDMDTCIALRTAVLKDDKIHIQAGCGIVADSDPESEYQETVKKAQALVRAVYQAVEFDE